MDALIRARILKLLDEYRIMSLATLRPDGWPQATTVGYVNDGLILYFMCGRDSQKARNLSRDNRISITIDHDVNSPMAIQGLSMAARAAPVQEAEWIRQTLMVMLPRKYPEYVQIMAKVNMEDITVFRVTPEIISLLDYSKRFGHTDLVAVRPEDLAGV